MLMTANTSDNSAGDHSNSPAHHEGGLLYQKEATMDDVDTLIEHNEVLDFLLGKSPTIRSDDTSSNTSTSSSWSSSVVESGHEESAHTCVFGKKDTVDELQPISESDSEVEPDNAMTHYSENPKTSAHRDSLPANDAQPEHEDASFCSSKHGVRRRSGVPTTSPINPQEAPSGDKQAPARQAHTGRNKHTAVLIVGVLGVLVIYCLAAVYRFFNPISYPLPNVDHLFNPWDVSDVSVQFRSPSCNDRIRGAVDVEWQVVNFPRDALLEHGPEPFEYRLRLDGTQILYEIDSWYSEMNEDSVINKTFHHRIRPRNVPDSAEGYHELEVEVSFPIPGSDAVLHTVSASTAFYIAPPEQSQPVVQIVSPQDGAVITASSFLIQYEMHDVHRLELLVDTTWRMRIKHPTDGNVLLRKLAVGQHSLRMQGFDVDGREVAADEVHIQLVDDEAGQLSIDDS